MRTLLAKLFRKKSALPGGGAAAAWLIAGLGNPGAEYARTRHNAGFLVLDRLAQTWDAVFRREKSADAQVFTHRHECGLVLGAKPQTFMNRSGHTVQVLMQKYKIRPERVLVVYDDLDIPFGRFRLRPQGGPGGHKGMQSIVERIGDGFPRLRVGLGPAPAGGPGLSGHVLAPFSPAEEKMLPEVLDTAANVILCLLVQGMEQAMNRYNAR